MANIAKNAILRAKIGGVINDIMVKTHADSVIVGNTGVDMSLTDFITQVIMEAINGKAAAIHQHEQSEVNGLVDALASKATNTALTEAINALRQEMLGDVPVEAYNTFTELAQYIEQHQEAADALTEAIGKKADQTTVDGIVETLNGLGALAQKDKISESDLESSLLEKVNSASEGNHAHLNKALLDTYTQTEADLADAVAKKHVHENKSVLDGISAVKVSAWDAAEQNAKTYADGLNTAMDVRVGAMEAKVTKWDAAEQNAKTYADGLNTEMDGRVDALEGNVDKWNAAEQNAKTYAKDYADGLNTEMDGRMDTVEEALAVNGTIYYSETEPANLTENDLWFQIVAAPSN